MFNFAFVVFLSVLCLSSGFKLEQSCSKFHYEEQTLEKLIRLQIIVEKTKDEMDDTKNKVIEALSELSKERDLLKEDVQTAINELNTVKSNVNNEITELQKQYSEAVESYKEDLTKFKDSSVTPVVAFESRTVTDRAMSDNKVLVFTNSRLDTSSSYNNQTGAFTVPVDGVYQFNAQICLGTSYANKYSYFSIYIGETSYISSHIGDGDASKCYTLSTIANVQKGNVITVRCKAVCSGNTLWEYAHAENSFSAVLIK